MKRVPSARHALSADLRLLSNGSRALGGKIFFRPKSSSFCGGNLPSMPNRISLSREAFFSPLQHRIFRWTRVVPWMNSMCYLLSNYEKRVYRRRPAVSCGSENRGRGKTQKKAAFVFDSITVKSIGASIAPSAMAYFLKSAVGQL